MFGGRKKLFGRFALYLVVFGRCFKAVAGTCGRHVPILAEAREDSQLKLGWSRRLFGRDKKKFGRFPLYLAVFGRCVEAVAVTCGGRVPTLAKAREDSQLKLGRFGRPGIGRDLVVSYFTLCFTVFEEDLMTAV